MANIVLTGCHNWWIVKVNKDELLYRNRNNAVYQGSNVVNGQIRKDGYLLIVDHDCVYINERENNTDVIDVHTRTKENRTKNAVMYFDEVPDAEKWQKYIHRHLNAVSEANPKLKTEELGFPPISKIKIAIGQMELPKKPDRDIFEGCPKPLKYAIIGGLFLLGISI